MSNRQVLYFNGTILTMDEDLPTAGAVLTEGERIVAVGDEAVLRSGPARDFDEFDLQGRTMMPAFIDPHGHFPDPGFIQLFRVDLAPPPRGDCVDMAAALLRLAEKTSQTPKGDWVMGVLFDNTAIAERRMPTRTELDGVSTEHPIWVLHASGHNGVANSCALDHQGIDRDTSDPAGGRFGRDPDTGDLTGLIEGISAMGAMGDTNFLIDHTRFWQGFAACRDEYLSHGVTFAQNAWASLDMLENFASLPAGDDPGIDILLLPIGELEPELTRETQSFQWSDTRYFTLGPRKLFTDGAFQLQTAFLTAPYHKPSNPDAPCGMSYTDRTDHARQVRKLHDMGFQIHCHCNGDAGTDLFLEAIDDALKERPARRSPPHGYPRPGIARRSTATHGPIGCHSQLFLGAHPLLGRSALRHLSGARSGQSHFTGRIGGTGRFTLYDPQRCVRHANPASASGALRGKPKNRFRARIGRRGKNFSPICSTGSND